MDGQNLFELVKNVQNNERKFESRYKLCFYITSLKEKNTDRRSESRNPNYW